MFTIINNKVKQTNLKKMKYIQDQITQLGSSRLARFRR